MLRASSLRPLVHRRFSTSPLIWNTIHQRPPTESPVNDEQTTHSPNTQLPDSDIPEHTKPIEISPHTPDRLNNSLTSYDLNLVRRRIREWTDHAAIAFRARADDFTAHTKATFSQLGSQLNKVTGYEVIEALKRGVVEQEARINASRQAAREAKIAYEEAAIRRSNSQREVNSLLERKSTWLDGDLVHFTALVRQDQIIEQEETRTKVTVDEAEAAVDREFTELMRSILDRYHEEQVWSDKIRSASTYGSLAALGLNMLVFVMAILVVEPWKRRRLTQTFEKKIEELSLENATRLEISMTEIGKQLANQEKLLAQATQILSQKPAVESMEPVNAIAEKSDQIEPPAVVVHKKWDLELITEKVLIVGMVAWMLTRGSR